MRQFRAAVVGAAASILCTLLLLSTAYARADEPAPQPFDIGAQSLAAALTEFARQTRQEILFAPDVVAQKFSSGVHGTMTPLAALRILLKESGLSFTSTPKGAILVGTAGSAAPLSSNSGNAAEQSAGDPTMQETQSFRDRFRLAQADQGQDGNSGVAPQDAQAPQKGSAKLEEVIVSAEKRSERLQEVPLPVTVINADVLVTNNQLRLQDYYTQVPGLSVTPGDYTNGAATINIRGITTGGTGYGPNPTVAIVVDDVPFGGSTALGGGGVPPDFDPSDLSRVEVLRGPQGTLYGASSLGGLLKFVTIDPSTAGVTGHVQADLSGVKNGAEAGYSVRGSINVPVSTTVAIRASAFARRDPGYIDNVQTGEAGVNRRDVDGGRLSALWRPSSAFSLKLSAMVQDMRTAGSDVVFAPGLGTADLQSANFALPTGELQQSTLPNSGVYRAKNQAYSLNLTGKLGTFDLTALTGYNTTTLYTNYDLSPLYASLTVPEFGVAGTVWNLNNKTSKLSQEIRLATPIGPHIDWLFGIFYTGEDVNHNEYYAALNSTTQATVAIPEQLMFTTAYREYAAFTDLTFHFTDQFDVQLGGRRSQIRQSYQSYDAGPWIPLFDNLPTPLINPEVGTKAESFTYLITPQFKISRDLMVYARLASGYRPGGPNFEPITGLPPSFAPDKTYNYEIGSKGDLLDHALSFDVSLYYIDWKNIQLYLVSPVNGSGFYTNGSGAKSEGIELSMQAKPTTGLSVSGWIALNNAELTAAFPIEAAASAYGAAGDRLPFTSHFSGNLALDQQFPLTARMTGFVGATESYVGNRLDVFTPRTTTILAQASSQRQKLPGFAQTDARAGVKFDTWTVNLFINNIMDRRGLLAGGLGNIEPFAFHIIQPRTLGLSVATTF